MSVAVINQRKGFWLQLFFMDLGSNALEGTLPDSWSRLSQVRRHLKVTVVLCCNLQMAF